MMHSPLSAQLDKALQANPAMIGLSSGLEPLTLSLASTRVAGAARPAASGAPTLVMLHGWQDNLASFHALVPYLPSEWGLLLFDWPGHGLSEHKPGDYYYPFYDYLDDLHQVLHQQRVSGPLILVGHSLGGLVASCYAAAFPDRIAALVMIEALGPMAEPAQQITNRLAKSLDQRLKQRQKRQRYFDSAFQALQLRASINKVAAEPLLPLVARGLMETPQGITWRHDPHLRGDALYRMSPAHSESIIRAIHCPALAIRGTDGYPALRSQDAQQRMYGFRQLQVVDLPGTHHCHLQQPQQAASWVTDFVTKIQTRT